MLEYAPRQFSASQEALSTDDEVILSARGSRTRALVRNTDGSISVYIGGSGVTSSTGFEIPAGDSVSIHTTAAVSAVADSGTPTIHILEEFN